MAALRKIAGILVQPDDKRFLEAQIEPDREVFDMANVEPVSLLSAYRKWQRNFTTAPFDPMGAKLRFFPGGFTIWSGFPGAGKTTLLRQLACHLLKAPDESRPTEGASVFVCSLEEAPDHVLIRHAEVACGMPELSTNALQYCIDVWSPRLKVWDYKPIEADAEYQRILAAIRVLGRDHGVRHVILDSLMCLDVPTNDFEAQRQFAGSLARTCMASGVHVHIVAHPRKPQQGNQRLDLSEVAGSADLGRKADNVLFVKRDYDNEQMSMVGNCTRMKIQVAKQRHGTGFLGEIDGWFHREFKQYVDSQMQTHPMQYLHSEAHRDIEARA